MPTVKPVRHVHIHRHYHYHAAPQPKIAASNRSQAAYLADAFLPQPSSPTLSAAPSVPPPPYYRTKPRPEAFWARQRWRAACWIEQKWEIVRPWAIWTANIVLRIIDFVLTRVTIGFMFRPIGDR
jgi:hypothetical protein